VGDHSATPGEEKLYEFEQKVPIPSYLFAVASGDIATAPIGPRSIVATGPNELEECKWELERDMEKFMEVAEKLVFPYKWGAYNVLVLPPSFPYGGKFCYESKSNKTIDAYDSRYGESHLHVCYAYYHQW
jgi:leukotriene-A4 hydrolase